MDVKPAGDGVYSAADVELDWGRVRVICLDLRYHKDPYSKDGVGDFLGEAQWAWLAEELARADSYYAVVVVSSLQLLERRYGLGESWGRFPAARSRLLRAVWKSTSALYREMTFNSTF